MKLFFESKTFEILDLIFLMLTSEGVNWCNYLTELNGSELVDIMVLNNGVRG